MTASHNHNTISCPVCQSEIELTEAVESKLRTEFESELASQRKEHAKRMQDLAVREASLSKAESDIEGQVSERVREAEAKLLQSASEKAKEQLSHELTAQADELKRLSAELSKAREAELKLRKSERELAERAESMELEIARRLDSERNKVREKAIADADESNRLKQAEKDHRIEGLLKKINELKQKAEQGSVQTQGEVLELDIERMLRASFPGDRISEVGKGIKGADVSQLVVSETGQQAGMILWETKRTKNWSDAWIMKLKDDQRAANASIAVLVSEALPNGISTIGNIDGVWVCSRASAQGLAVVLRSGLKDVARTALVAEGTETKRELVYNYLASQAFQSRVSGIVESFMALQEDIVTEERAMQKRLAKRRKHLERAVAIATGLCGDIEGIVGAEHAKLGAIGQLYLEEPNMASPA